MFIVTLSFVLALAGYAVMCHGMIRAGIVQPVSATLMWFALDALAAWVSYRQGGSYLLPAGYALGCVAAFGVTVCMRQWVFAKSDLFALGLVLICTYVWQASSGDAAIIASALAVLFAGLPLMIMYWKNPKLGSLPVWVIFSLANGLGLAGAQGWAIDQWFFPVCALTGSLGTIIIIARKYAKKN